MMDSITGASPRQLARAAGIAGQFVPLVLLGSGQSASALPAARS